MREPTPLHRSIERMVRLMGAPRVELLGPLQAAWTDLVGPAVGGASTPVRLVDGCLHVRCDDGAWASQVQWMQRQLVERIESRFPDLEIRRITVAVTPRHSP